MFTGKLVNRLVYPIHRVIVVEDDLNNQRDWSIKLLERYGFQGETVPSILGNAVDAYSLIKTSKDLGLGWPRWIALDHDLQLGDGYELILALKDIGYDNPILMASGIPSNNERMLTIYKGPVIQGKGLDSNLNKILDSIENS